MSNKRQRTDGKEEATGSRAFNPEKELYVLTSIFETS
jgi:hypothetical protein